MPLLNDVRSLFRKKRKPVEIDLRGTQAAALDDAGGARAASPAATAIEPKSVRSRTASDGNRSLEEIMSLVRKISDHLDGQTDRTERMLQLIDRMPQALDALPEINRQNARLLESLHAHLDQARRREEALNDTLATITEAAKHQTEVLGLVQQQLDHSSQSSAQLTGTLSELRQSLSDLAQANTHSSEVLSKMAEATGERENRLTDTLTRTQRWIIAGVLCASAASIAAIATAIVAVVS
jgi:DNA repair exonuclease SbcCD ATPase subunit